MYGDSVKLEDICQFKLPEISLPELQLQPLIHQSFPTVRRIIIVGPQGSGKSTLAHLLHELSGQGYFETSTLLIAYFARFCAESNGCPNCADYRDFILQRKSQYRRNLVAFCNALVRANPSCLIADAAAIAPIIVGPRRKAEIAAWFKEHPGDVLIEIQRPGAGCADDLYELHGQSSNYIHGVLIENINPEVLRGAAQFIATRYMSGK